MRSAASQQCKLVLSSNSRVISTSLFISISIRLLCLFTWMIFFPGGLLAQNSISSQTRSLLAINQQNIQVSRAAQSRIPGKLKLVTGCQLAVTHWLWLQKINNNLDQTYLQLLTYFLDGYPQFLFEEAKNALITYQITGATLANQKTEACFRSNQELVKFQTLYRKEIISFFKVLDQTILSAMGSANRIDRHSFLVALRNSVQNLEKELTDKRPNKDK